MHSIGESGAAVHEPAAELALSAKALGALLGLNDALHVSDDDQTTLVQRLCGGIAPLHPGSLIFIAEETREGLLSVSHAEGMGAAVIRDVSLEWPAPERLAPFAAAAGACGFWRVPSRQVDLFGPTWMRLCAELDAGEVVLARIGAGASVPLILALFSVKRAGLRESEVHLLQYIAKAMRKTLAAAGERRALRQENRRLRLAARVFEHAMEGVIITDADQRIVAVNKSVSRVTGYAEDELIGATPRLLNSGHHHADFYREMWRALRERGHWKGEIWNRRKNGEIYPELLSLSAIHDECGEIGHYLGIFIDLTLQKDAERRLSHLALHDPLTGLPNRESFRARIDRALRRGGRHAVLLLDIDRFKNINDTFGHPEGDILLKSVSVRLHDAMRPQDFLARLGGDEFAVLMEDVTDRNKAAGLARTLHQALAAPFRVDQLEVGMTASIGVSMAPDDGTEASTLIRHADAAMYEAKRGGGANSEFSVPGISAEVRRQLEIESELRHAVERDELRLHYQVQVDLASGRIVGMEALLRWMKPGVGLVGPSHFIALAEETGLIVPIGEWVLNEACRQCKAWQDAGHAELQVAVNLSARQLSDERLADKVKAALGRSGLDPASLELELTESVAVDSMEGGLAALHLLRGIGIKLAVDDFGTGFSSLNNLKRLPIDRLKIEHSFVKGVTSDRHDAAIVNSIVTLARALDLQVVAEGVMTEEQINHLRRIGCHQAQGFYYGRPAPAEAIPNLDRPITLHRRNAMFDFLFRKEKPIQHNPAAIPPLPTPHEAAAPGTAIRYNPGLVAEFKHDHQQLLTLFAAIQAAFKEGRLQSVVEHLETFRTSIQSHLLKENVRLYIYLEHQLADDETSYQLIHDFRHEMDGIGKAVVGFLAKYRDLSVDGNLVASFGRDLEAVGKVLVARIQREEATLYPLYAPAY